jgi:hypothetical protein
LLPLPLFPSPFTVISAGDPVLEDLRFIVRESGKSFLSFTPPLSRDEVLLILENIDADNLTPAEAEAYSRVLEACNPKPLFSSGLFSVGVHINAAVEARVRTNPDIPWIQKDKESPAVLAIPVDLYFADRVQLYMEPVFTRGIPYYGEAGAYFGTNIPLEAGQVDISMPFRAFAAAGGSWWNFELGRDRLSYGLGRSGNMAISDTPDFYDMARLSLFSPALKYSLLVSQIPFEINNTSVPDTTIQPAEGDITRTTQRYLYVHRFDIRLFRRVSIGLTEAIMVGNSPLEVRFLNPMMIFHSFSAWRDYDRWGETAENRHADMVGSLFSIDFNWAVVRSLSLYGQFVMNELSTPYELEHYPDNQAPNATGFLAGAEYTRDFAGWAASFYAEFMYSDPYLYTLSTPFASYIWTRRISDLDGLRYNWIGHAEGRDTVLYLVGSSVSKRNLGFFLNLSFIQKGEHTIIWDWNMGKGYNDQKTPSGLPEHKLALVLGSHWKPLSLLELSAQVGGSAVFNAGHISGTQKYGLDAVFSVKFTY